MMNFYQMIETRPIPLNERRALGHKHVNKCAPDANFEHLRMFYVTENGHQIKHSKHVSFDNSSLANFYIVLEVSSLYLHTHFTYILLLITLVVEWPRMFE